MNNATNKPIKIKDLPIEERFIADTGKFFRLPDIEGHPRGICYQPLTLRGIFKAGSIRHFTPETEVIWIDL